MWYKVAICSKDGFGGKLIEKAEKIKDEEVRNGVIDLINDAEVFLGDPSVEILSWAWIKWNEDSPVVKFILANLPKKYDIITIDEDDNVYAKTDTYNILGTETTITWPDQRFDDARRNRDLLCAKLKGLKYAKKERDVILKAVDDIYGV